IAKLTRIFATIVPAFLPREKPISRNAKPACMNITRMPATSTQTELMATSAGNLPAVTLSSVPLSAKAAAGTASAATKPVTKPAAQRVQRIRPPLSNSIEAESASEPPDHHCPRVEDSPAALLPAVETTPRPACATSTAMSSRITPPLAASDCAKHASAGGERLAWAPLCSLGGGLAAPRGEQPCGALGREQARGRAGLGQAV